MDQVRVKTYLRLTPSSALALLFSFMGIFSKNSFNAVCAQMAALESCYKNVHLSHTVCTIAFVSK